MDRFEAFSSPSIAASTVQMGRVLCKAAACSSTEGTVGISNVGLQRWKGGMFAEILDQIQ